MSCPRKRCGAIRRTAATTAKRALFGTLRDQAARDGYPVLMDGTNASDDAGDRPGMRAIRELSVRSPCGNAGYKGGGAKAVQKPGCLPGKSRHMPATRIPTGEEITAGLLQKVEQAEDRLFSLGFTDFRVRVFHNARGFQLPEDQMAEAWRAGGRFRRN